MSDTRTRRRLAIALAGVLLLGVLGVLDARFDFESARDGAGAAWSLLKSAPAPIYFACMAVIILAPVPASVFYITAGSLYGIVPSLLWIAPVLAVNALLVHSLVGGWLRPRVERLIAGRGLQIPKLNTRNDQVLFITLIRITPGIPYFIQSWVLGLANVDRMPFLVITVGIQMFYATGFVVLGRSAFEGEFGLTIGAIALLVAVSIIARIVHTRFRRLQTSTLEGTSTATAGEQRNSH